MTYSKNGYVVHISDQVPESLYVTSRCGLVFSSDDVINTSFAETVKGPLHYCKRCMKARKKGGSKSNDRRI